MYNNSVGPLSFAASSSSSVSLSPNQSADIPPYSIPIETAIKILCKNYENCTEDILLQNFNILCTLPNAIAKYEKPLSAKSVSRILSNVCLWDNGQKILKEMVLILKDKKVLLGCCDKPDNYGLNKNLLSLSVELF